MAIPSYAGPDLERSAYVDSQVSPGSTRLSFDWGWHEKIPFTVKQNGKMLRLHFTKAVSLDWDPEYFKALKPYVQKVQTNKHGADILITLRRPMHVRPYWDANESGFDLVAASGAPVETLSVIPPARPKHRVHLAHAMKPVANIPAEKAQAAAAPEVKEMARNEIPASEDASLAGLSPAAGEAAPAPAVTTAPATSAPVTPVIASPQPAAPEAAPAPATSAPITPVIASPQPAAPEAALAPSASPASSPAPVETQAAAPTAAPAPAAAPVSPAPAAPQADSPPELQAPAAKSAAKESIAVPVREDEPFAAFMRKKTLWIVAGDATHMNADLIAKQNPGFANAIKTISAPHAAIFTVTLPAERSAIVEKAQDGVHVILESGSPHMAQPLLASVHTDAGGHSSILLKTLKADQIIATRDPATGNDLLIALLPKPGAGVAVGRSFVEFALLPSAQGVAVQKLSDAITVAANKDGVEITAPKGLAISAELAQQIEDAESEALTARGAASFFPYGRWKIDDEKNLVQTEIKLGHDIAYSPPETANRARLKLLGLFLSEGLFPEARGMANDILRSSYKFYRDNKVAALRGAAFFFSYRIAEAERDFSSPELAGFPETAMWLTLCHELLGDSSQTFSFLSNYDRFIHFYPPSFIQKLAIIAADRSINRKDYDTAMSIFDTLKKENIDEPVKKYVDYMHAKVLSENHNEDEAAKIWEQQAGMVDDPLIRARAEFSLVNMLLRQEKITSEDAAKRLERLRIVWRGDSLELNVLTLLGGIYVNEKQYGKALHTLRDIVLYYPEMPEAITTAKQMEDIFVTLYDKGGADSMPPLEALSLFYEFRDLVPVGEDGDQMIRNLADRLVGIDLLDRAALLLDHQIRKRLHGDERSRVGARLALIYLMNHQPKEALETLKTTGYGDLPPDLKLSRLRLTAQALAQQNHVDKAIDVLASDNSADGALLRLSIYWDNRDWQNVVATAEEILGNRNDPSAALTLQESEVLIKLATAYVYEHDTGQIQYLRDYFTPLLKNNPNKDSFLFITTESGAVDYDNLANLEQDITSVKGFLDTYRDQVKKNGLSKSIN